MKKFKLILASFLAIVGIATAVTVPAYAQPSKEIRDGVSAAGSDPITLQTRIKQIVNTMLFLLGVIAVIMIVIGGIKYTTSNGDAAAVTSAKNTVLYSAVGLVVAILAYAIVNFVLDAFK